MMLMSRLLVILATLLSLVPEGRSADPPGYGPWRLGMSKEQVRALSKDGPYVAVSATGGLETANGSFNGRKTNVSFVFGERGLRKIQIWAYEGEDRDKAIEAWHRVHKHLVKNYGVVKTPAFELAKEADSKAFSTAAARALAEQPADRVANLQMAPLNQPNGMIVYSSILRHPERGYYVFLYYQELNRSAVEPAHREKNRG